MRPGVATGQRDGYTAALSGLWNRLARSLADLEAIASNPELLDEDEVLERLPPLPTEEAIATPPAGGASALASFSLAVCGALIFAAGATLSLWPIWALGLALVAGGFLVYAPRP